MTFETPDDVLEHFGVRGMKWGVRKARSGASGVVNTAKAHPTATKRVALGAAFAAAVIGGGVAGSKLSTRNHLGPAGRMTMMNLHNDRAARILINEGHRFTRNSTESTLLFNAARQVREGLRDDLY
jgi:hypothetical protein